MRISYFILLVLIFPLNIYSQGYYYDFHENFESSSSLPPGWTQKYTHVDIDPVDWKFQNGGYQTNPSDTLSRKPLVAYEGIRNALFAIQSTEEDATMLITPEIKGMADFAIQPELKFWHAQVRWLHGEQYHNDELKVYYKKDKDRQEQAA